MHERHETSILYSLHMNSQVLCVSSERRKYKKVGCERKYGGRKETVQCWFGDGDDM
jgi:hypothetical protein